MRCTKWWRNVPFPRTATFGLTKGSGSRASRLKGLPLPAAACGGLGCGERTGDRAADQPAGVRCHHHCCHLQGPLGDRTILQDSQAEPQGEELRGHQRKRSADPDLDSPDRYSAAEMASPSLEGQMVALQSGLDVAAEPLYLSGFEELAGRSVPDTATAARIPTTHSPPGMIWTGNSGE